VRSAVVWVGLPDPGETRLRLQTQADVTAEGMALLLGCWEQMDPDRRGLTAAEVLERLYKSPPTPAPAYHADMKAAVDSLVGKADSRALGNKLRGYRRRIFEGRFIDQAGTQQRAARWAVYPARAFGDRLKKTHETHSEHPEEADPAPGGSESVSVSESFLADGPEVEWPEHF
jgi:hypothetical protein